MVFLYALIQYTKYVHTGEVKMLRLKLNWGLWNAGWDSIKMVDNGCPAEKDDTPRGRGEEIYSCSGHGKQTFLCGLLIKYYIIDSEYKL